MYKPVKNGLKIGTVNVPVTDLAKGLAQIVAFTYRFVTLFRRVYLEQKLELPPS